MRNASQRSDACFTSVLSKFSEHLGEMRKHLERSVWAFNGAVGSYETELLPQGRKLKDEASLLSEELSEIPPIDVVPREVSALDTGMPSKRLPRSQQLFAKDDAV